MRTILVALDASPASRHAAEFVNEFFDGVDAEIFTLNVGAEPPAWAPADLGTGATYPWPWPAAPDYDDWVGRMKDAARESAALTLAQSRLERDADVVRTGDPADVITDVAEELDADLVVVGTNEKGLFERIVSGSIAKRVLKDSPIPVLVIR